MSTLSTLTYSTLAEQLEPEGAFVYLKLAEEVEKKGKKVISFGIGQPDFKPPEDVLSAIKEAIDKGFIKYIPSLGLPELRAGIAEYLNDKYGADIKPEEVAVTVGAKSAIFMTISLLTRIGDEVIVPDPGFPAYECIVRYSGGRPKFLVLKEENDFRIDPKNIEQCISKNTKCIIVNSPHNPTGSVLTRKDVRDIIDIARKRNLAIISDEIYEDFVYEGKHYSFLKEPDWRDYVVYISGFSKTWALTGLRLGIIVARKEIIDRIDVFANNLYSCPPTPIQYGALKALEIGLDWFKNIKEEYEKRRNTACEELNRIPGVRVSRMPGSFYLFPNVKELLNRLGYRKVDELAKAMLYETRVVLLPGTAFPLYGGEGYMRISYVLPVSVIREGLGRVRNWVEEKI
ncbi:MAG: pyridoxal phosphate-dependent aminotransferase [Thermoprotei archaeon]|nr:MAG: pyridoxal phosphate-dependent aminotransferase [Thermoprotei archaeon]